MKKHLLFACLVMLGVSRPVLATDPFPLPPASVTFDITTGVVYTGGSSSKSLNFPLGAFQINSSSALDRFALSTDFFQMLASVDDASIFRELIAAEGFLGDPPVEGYVLAGSPNGGRTWVPPGGTGSVLDVNVTQGHGIKATVADKERHPNIIFNKLTNIDPDNVTLPFGGRITGTTSSYPDTNLTSATLDWSQSNNFQRKYTTNTTMVFSNRVNGDLKRLKLQQTSGTLTWPAAVVAPTPAAPSAAAEDIYECQDWNGSVICRLLSAGFTVGATPSPTVSPSPTPVVTPTPTPTPTPSPTATPTVTPPPVITKQPVNKTVTVPQTASFSVTATGAPTLSYQWKKNGASLTGATMSSYITPATNPSYNGTTYSVVVANPGGNVTSANATLTVLPAPTATPTPINTPTPSPTATATPAPAVAPRFVPSSSSPRHNPVSFTVAITTTTSGAQMRYTLNGTTPTATNGTLIAGTSGTATIPASAYTVLKAITFKTGIPTSTVTSGYYDNTYECCETGSEACCSQ